MKLCRFQPLEFTVDAMGASIDPAPLYGIVESGSVRELLGSPLTEWRLGERTWRLDRVRLLAPAVPSKIICVGRNYREHAAEFGNPVPKDLIIFLKPPSSVIGPEEPIVLTPLSRRVDYEGEIAVVIGRRCYQLDDSADVPSYVLGYTCLNDVTARDLQRADVQWTRGKGFDTFCPIGPVIETELDIANAAVETYVNGAKKQSAPVTDMVFAIDYIVRFISNVMTLLPGDVIATGTPSGVGQLSAGDVVEVAVKGVGTLRNPVAAQGSHELAVTAAALKTEEVARR